MWIFVTGWLIGTAIIMYVNNYYLAKDDLQFIKRVENASIKQSR